MSPEYTKPNLGRQIKLVFSEPINIYEYIKSSQVAKTDIFVALKCRKEKPKRLERAVTLSILLFPCFLFYILFFSVLEKKERVDLFCESLLLFIHGQMNTQSAVKSACVVNENPDGETDAHEFVFYSIYCQQLSWRKCNKIGILENMRFEK